MPPSQPAALATLARTALDAAARYDVDLDAILRAAGVSRELVDDSDARIPVAALMRVWEEAERASGDPCFGLRAGAEVVSARSLHVVGYAARNGSSLGECYEHTVRYAALTNEASDIVLTREPTRAIVSVTPKAGLPPYPRVYAEMAMAAYLHLGQRWAGASFDPIQVTFQHAAPEDLTQHKRILGPEVRFDAPRNQLILPRATLELPFGATDPDIYEYFATRADELLEARDDATFQLRVRAAIARGLGREPLTLDRVALSLSTSARTLQRRLATAGQSFTDVVDDVRRVTALRLLDRGFDVSTLAARVGYRDTAAFRNAFQRWTGSTPRAAQARRRAR